MAPSDDNQQIYEDVSVIEFYREAATPQQAELSMFEPLNEELRAGRLLDIGIGAGRTTAYLAPKVGHYVGVDYSHGLVDAAQRLYPEAEIIWCDARDMSAFEDASFDFVNFSFNGLDSLDHLGRLQVLGEVHRVLRPAGHLMFSSHNRDYKRRGLLPWQGQFKPGRVMLKKSRMALRHHQNWRRLRKQQLERPEYALVNDEAHGYALLNYYISPAAQVRQLEATGFTDVAVYDQSGELTEESSSTSIWMHYACRRV